MHSQNLRDGPTLADPLSEVIALLQPRTVCSKGITGAGNWAVRYSEFGQTSFCAVLQGTCRLSVDGHKPIIVQEGDFVLLPSTPGFTMSTLAPAVPTFIDPKVAAMQTEEVRHGCKDVPAEVHLLGGYFTSESPNADLLLTLFPTVVHVSGSERLSTLVQMVREESVDQHVGCDQALPRLVELLMIEALRLTIRRTDAPGLPSGLADPYLAPAIRKMHRDVAFPWTVKKLAAESALSRSAFYTRFTRTVGVPPMEYLMTWRMALAKSLLREEGLGVAEVAERVGYASASAFSTAFSRQMGVSPRGYSRG